MTPASNMVLDLHEYAIHSQIATLERGLTNLARVLSPMESLMTAPKPGYIISESMLAALRSRHTRWVAELTRLQEIASGITDRASQTGQVTTP